MQTQDVDLYFQTDADLKRAVQRKQKASRPVAGSPLRLSTKPLDVIVQDDDIWVAESGFTIKRIDLLTGKTKQVYKGHTGPVPCIALIQNQQKRPILVSGSWDKSIIFCNTANKEILTRIEKAHTDFVKSLLVIPELNLLVSGGSDKDVRVWDISNLQDEGSSANQPPTFKASLREHTRPVDCLQYRLVSPHVILLLSADSMGKVCMWRFTKEKDSVSHHLLHHWRPHETAICDMQISDTEIWTASADNSVCLCRYDAKNPESPPMPSMRIRQPYYVKSLLPLPLVAPQLEERFLVTGSTDEGLRVFDLDAIQKAKKNEEDPFQNKAAVPETSDQGLVRLLDEHFHEINKLALWATLEDSELAYYVLSISLDGTIRRWLLSDLLNPEISLAPQEPEPDPTEPERLMTEDEEAELAELMGDM